MNDIIKKPILLSALSQFESIDKVIIESLEQALYRVVIEIDGQEYYVMEKKGRAFTRHSIVAIQEQLQLLVIKEMYLQHSSPYDEMIGLEVNKGGNTLLVPLANYFDNTRVSTSKTY